MAILQKIHKTYSDVYEMYLRYYQVFFSLNDIHVPKSELQLLSFVAVHDNISNTTTRRDFLNRYNTTQYTLNNNVSNLCKKGYLFKDKDKKVRVHPSIKIPSDNIIGLQITLDARNREENS